MTLMMRSVLSVNLALNREMTVIRVVIIALTVVILFLIWLTVRLGTHPLIRAEQSIAKEEPIEVKGAREFRNLARGYNRLHEKLYGNKEENP